MNNRESTYKKLFGTEWYEQLEKLIHSDYFKKLGTTIANLRKKCSILPEQGSELFLKVFREVPYSKVRVICIGQDIYHNGMYNGLAFGNGKPDEKIRVDKISPSLNNIWKEVENDCYKGLYLDFDTSLYSWARQGVFLINCAHTVEEGNPGSHIKLWEQFTKEVISKLKSIDDRPIVWLLWGNFAYKAFGGVETVSNTNHLILTAKHPSPLSANQGGWFGCKHFSKANQFFKDNNVNEIKW